MTILASNTDISGAVVYVGRNDAVGTYCYLAMKINLPYAFVITGVGLYWGAKSSTAEYISPTINLRNDNGGLPTGALLVSVSAGSPANNAGWLDHTFPTVLRFEANTDYWLRIDNGGSQNNPNYNALNTAASGAMKTSYDVLVTWVDVARDLSYKVYGNKIVLPFKSRWIK